MTFPDIMLAVHFLFIYLFFEGRAKHGTVKLTRAAEGASIKNVSRAPLRVTSNREKVGPHANAHATNV